MGVVGSSGFISKKQQTTGVQGIQGGKKMPGTNTKEQVVYVSQPP